MAGIVGVFRNVVFLGWLSIALVSTTIAAGIWALQMTTTVAAMSAKAASTAVAHRKQLAKAVAKAKAKARLRRAVVAVPIAGVAAIGYFEEQDYQEWLAENPDGTRKQYACEVASLTAEVVDEVLQDLPGGLRPDPETVLGYMPECE
ncbi:hypothetical protein BXY70_2977 [Roseovarius halotolerans]|uniref:Uncharacterized protein n=1 Tax=Roseovarius halotolerans TaxID=505353 RepID=A0A1X6ZHP4_9RHOB|nr:hypothetical protein [Roseovarius halotolerans]RKT30980.1 hypothetical protein BXY70_2977 [Roseovarius halotolerans]SLN51924.1 hypothetical protein ROH8110_02873 [Roseovarius halotolerans]